MKINKLKRIGASLLLGAAILAQPITALAASQYKLENSVKAYYSADSARSGVDARATYGAGNYYVYKEFNGMLNITRKENQPGGWINPKDNKAQTIKPVTKTVTKAPVEKKETTNVGVKNSNGTFSLKVKTYGYMNAANAKDHAKSVNVKQPGTYYIYKEYNGMINITTAKGVPGTWINPGNVKEVKPAIPQTSSKKVTTPVVKKAPTLEKLYSLSRFKYLGLINWGGYRYTYYSQKVLPGGGLRIPGRHVNKDGYVSDGDGYIVLANSAAKGTVFPTPFGYMGKVYDRGTYGNHLDVYVD